MNITTARNHGYTFEAEVKRGLDVLASEGKGYPIRLQDTRAFDPERIYVKCPACHHPFKWNTPFTAPKVPGDFFMLTPHTGYLIEAKSSYAKSFPIANIRPHQLTESVAISKMYPRGQGLFLINRREPKPIKAWALDGVALARMVDDAKARGRAAIPWADVESAGVPLARDHSFTGDAFWRLDTL